MKRQTKTTHILSLHVSPNLPFQRRRTPLRTRGSPGASVQSITRTPTRTDQGEVTIRKVPARSFPLHPVPDPSKIQITLREVPTTSRGPLKRTIHPKTPGLHGHRQPPSTRKELTTWSSPETHRSIKERGRRFWRKQVLYVAVVA